MGHSDRIPQYRVVGEDTQLNVAIRTFDVAFQREVLAHLFEVELDDVSVVRRSTARNETNRDSLHIHICF